MRVRQAVGAVAGDLLRISTAAGGYTLESEPAAVDALLFRDLVARTGRAGDPDTALRWHGQRPRQQPDRRVRLTARQRRRLKVGSFADEPRKGS